MTRPALKSTPARAVTGASLIELMTAITIGLLILVGLTSVFVNSSTSNRELKNTAEQIENGRYAIDLLSQDIRHAGFYGELSTLPTVPATAPDPCAVPATNVAPAAVDSSLALPLQRIDPAGVPAGCAGFLTAANLAANSDIVVVRRTETAPLSVTCTTGVTLKTVVTAADPFPAGYLY